eukprot:GEMP01072124.1.p1 GENE.GEMP01072124.1~~GEMP01072124.1.p1  ORF type:complete len:356 (+),score=87.03 GEMP01072124.1:44-1111(+)
MLFPHFPYSNNIGNYINNNAPTSILESLGEVVPEDEAKVAFCPVLGLPLVMERRVRTSPGFHILSQEAGIAAQKQGTYEAYGAAHQCESIELLHKNDEVFVTHDKKAFLTETSMQYYNYVHYELEEQRNERQLLHDRAEQRKRRRGVEKERAEREREDAARRNRTRTAVAAPLASAAVKNSAPPPARKLTYPSSYPAHPQVHAQSSAPPTSSPVVIGAAPSINEVFITPQDQNQQDEIVRRQHEENLRHQKSMQRAPRVQQPIEVMDSPDGGAPYGGTRGGASGSMSMSIPLQGRGALTARGKTNEEELDDLLATVTPKAIATGSKSTFMPNSNANSAMASKVSMLLDCDDFDEA